MKPPRLVSESVAPVVMTTEPSAPYDPSSSAVPAVLTWSRAKCDGRSGYTGGGPATRAGGPGGGVKVMRWIVLPLRIVR